MSGESESYVPFPRWLFNDTYHYGILGEIGENKRKEDNIESSKYMESTGPEGHGGIGLERALFSESDTWFLPGPGHSLCVSMWPPRALQDWPLLSTPAFTHLCSLYATLLTFS